MPKTITLADCGKTFTIRALTRAERREYMAFEEELRKGLPKIPNHKLGEENQERAMAELDMTEKLQDWLFAKLGLAVDAGITPIGDLNRLYAEIMGRTMGAPEAEVKNS